MPLVAIVDEVPNQLLSGIQLEMPVLFEQDLTKVLGTILVLVSSENLII